MAPVDAVRQPAIKGWQGPGAGKGLAQMGALAQPSAAAVALLDGCSSQLTLNHPHATSEHSPRRSICQRIAHRLLQIRFQWVVKLQQVLGRASL